MPKEKEGPKVRYASYRGHLCCEEDDMATQGDIYTAEGKPAAYQDISVCLFIQGYLITMDIQDSSVKQMGDGGASQRPDVRCRNVLVGECPCISWGLDKSDRAGPVYLAGHQGKAQVQMGPGLAHFHLFTPSSRDHKTSPSSGQCKGAYNAPARPGTKAFKAFNQGSCPKATTAHWAAEYLRLLFGHS